MSNDAGWITVRITEARKRHTSVTVAVSTRLEGLLNGKLGERPLRQAERAEIAKALIADMVISTPPNAEAKQ